MPVALESLVAVCFNQENQTLRTAIISLPAIPAGLAPLEYYQASQTRNREHGARIASLFGFKEHRIEGQTIPCGEDGLWFIALAPLAGSPDSFIRKVQENMIEQTAGYTSGMNLSSLIPAERLAALSAHQCRNLGLF